MTAAYELDVLVPVYNEGANIRRTLDVLFQSNREPFHVQVCYDRDDDNTLPELEKCPDVMRGRIDLIKNEGQGAHGAICTGFRRSTAPAVVVYPADDDYNPGVLDLMFHKWKDENCEIVAASRFMPGGCMVGCPWLKATLVRCAAFTLYHLAGLPTRDPSNGFRLFSRRVLDQFSIESTAGFVYSIELLVKVHRAGWKIGEVPAQWRERTAGSSRFRVLKWLPAYLHWYFYAFATSYLGRKPKGVKA
jgi:glycosyltransferase involved in cell wall biosynthesis